jgi:hypothetical protein
MVTYWMNYPILVAWHLMRCLDLQDRVRPMKRFMLVGEMRET